MLVCSLIALLPLEVLLLRTLFVVQDSLEMYSMLEEQKFEEDLHEIFVLE